jgi:hypothetical protein
MSDTTLDQRHDCGTYGCQHGVAFADEAKCYYHTPPVMVEHNCARENCAHWKTGETVFPITLQGLKAMGLAKPPAKSWFATATDQEIIDLGEPDF